jgi:hypothetical protein
VLDGGHGVFDGLGDVLILRQVAQVAVAGVLGEIETAPAHGDLVQGPFAPGALECGVLGLDGGLMAAVVDVGKLEEDQTEDGGAVFGRLEIRVRPQVIGGGPEVVFEFLELVAGHWLRQVLGCAMLFLFDIGSDEPERGGPVQRGLADLGKHAMHSTQAFGIYYFTGQIGNQDPGAQRGLARSPATSKPCSTMLKESAVLAWLTSPKCPTIFLN